MKAKVLLVLVSLVVLLPILGCTSQSYELRGTVVYTEESPGKHLITFVGGSQEAFYSSPLLDQIEIGKSYIIKYHKSGSILVATVDSVETLR